MVTRLAAAVGNSLQWRAWHAEGASRYVSLMVAGNVHPRDHNTIFVETFYDAFFFFVTGLGCKTMMNF
jgi:hypothetical protein